MTWLPLALATKSNQTRFGFEGAGRLINAYAEATGDEAKNTFAVYATEGLDTRITPAPGRVYCVLETESYLYGVSGVKVWAIDTSNVVTILGTLSAEGMCTMARNRKSPTTEVGLVSAGENKYYTISATTMTLNTDPDLLGPPTCIAVKDGYFIIPTNFSRYFITGEDSATTIAATDFGKAQRTPGEITRVVDTETEIVLFKADGIEWHQNSPTSTATFPFVPIAAIDLGLGSAMAVTKLDRDIVFLASDGTIRRLVGYGAEPISTPSVQRAIGAVEDQSTISAFSWNSKTLGHSFVAFTCSQWTWVYDLSQGTWHERKSYGLDFWRVSTAFEWDGKLMAGDYSTGELYDMSGNYHDEGGDPLIMTVQCPPLDGFPYPIVVDALAIDATPGVGINSPSQPANENPQLMIDYSTDGGATFGTERRESMGALGQTNTTITATKFGMFRRNGVTWRFRCSAAVACGIQSARINVTKLKA